MLIPQVHNLPLNFILYILRLNSQYNTRSQTVQTQPSPILIEREMWLKISIEINKYDWIIDLTVIKTIAFSYEDY
jgi:hypothetical protein